MAAAAMVIGTTQATGKTEKRPPSRPMPQWRVGEIAEDQQGIDAGDDRRQSLHPDPPRGEARAGPAQRAEQGQASGSAAQICLIAAGRHVEAGGRDKHGQQQKPRHDDAREAGPPQGPRVRFANQALRRFADLVRARKCRRDLHAEAIRGRRGRATLRAFNRFHVSECFLQTVRVPSPVRCSRHAMDQCRNTGRSRNAQYR